MGGVIKLGGAWGIICPQNGCAKLMEAYEIQNLVDKPAYERYVPPSPLCPSVLVFDGFLIFGFRYDLMLRDLAIEDARDTKWCPTPNCGNAIIKDRKSPMEICFKCKVRILPYTHYSPETKLASGCDRTVSSDQARGIFTPDPICFLSSNSLVVFTLFTL